jgi:hypothetical protein
MPKKQSIPDLKHQQALRAATVQVTKILHGKAPMTITEIQEQTWFRRKYLREALEAHPHIIRHGIKGPKAKYEIELPHNDPHALHVARKDKQIPNRLIPEKAPPGKKTTPGKRKKK